MQEKIKLIWDFYGEDALKTAKHHCIHLQEFATIKQIAYHQISHYQQNEMHVIAYVTVDKSDMEIYRDNLKPHRAELA